MEFLQSILVLAVLAGFGCFIYIRIKASKAKISNGGAGGGRDTGGFTDKARKK